MLFENHNLIMCVRTVSRDDVRFCVFDVVVLVCLNHVCCISCGFDFIVVASGCLSNVVCRLGAYFRMLLRVSV